MSSVEGFGIRGAGRDGPAEEVVIAESGRDDFAVALLPRRECRQIKSSTSYIQLYI